MTRRQLREHLIRMLYIRDFHDKELIEEQNELYLAEYAPGSDEEEKKEILLRYDSIIEKLPTIDAMIDRASRGWKLSRIGKMDLNILRLAVFEILYDESVPDKAAANEAVDLARDYGSDESSYGFVNGILASFIKDKAK